MAIIDINHTPSKNDLRWFGVILLAIFLIVASITLFRFASETAAATIATMGAILCVAYYAIRPLRWPMYQAWMRLFYPIGFTVSHVMMGTIFFLILTPIGLAMRLVGHDPMQRRWDANTQSYWTRHAPSRDIDRYFRQS